MYSGGPGSMGALYRLFTDPAYEGFDIHIHHMNLIHGNNAMPAERQAVQRTLAYLKANHDKRFFYTECSHDLSFMKQTATVTNYWYGFMAANIITADPQIVHLATGHTRINPEDPTAPTKRLNINRGLEIYNATLPLEIRFERPCIYPVAHLTRQAVWAMLPADLRDIAWFCHDPVEASNTFTPCGRCPGCAHRQAVDNAEIPLDQTTL